MYEFTNIRHINEHPSYYEGQIQQNAAVSAMNMSRVQLVNIFLLLLTRVGVGKVLLLIPDADGAG